MSRPAGRDVEKVDRPALIVEATLSLLARHGISGVSMRAVAKEAKVALGLLHYYFDDKTALVAAALRRVGEQDIAIVEPAPALAPEERLRAALHKVADKDFLTTEYLSLRPPGHLRPHMAVGLPCREAGSTR